MSTTFFLPIEVRTQHLFSMNIASSKTSSAEVGPLMWHVIHLGIVSHFHAFVFQILCASMFPSPLCITILTRPQPSRWT